jgi:hypothetical protein
MNLQNRILPVALVAALLGGTVGAFVMRGRNAQPETQVASASLLPNSSDQQNGAGPATLRYNDNQTQNNDANAVNGEESSAYRAGFTDGFDAARDNRFAATRERVVTRTAAPTRVVYRSSAPRRASARSTRTAYYDYEPRRRSFWQKHRDKLTVAMGTGGGALIGGLIGGKKGAAIGALSGAGCSALYTYKIRNRNRRY